MTEGELFQFLLSSFADLKNEEVRSILITAVVRNGESFATYVTLHGAWNGDQEGTKTIVKMVSLLLERVAEGDGIHVSGEIH